MYQIKNIPELALAIMTNGDIRLSEGDMFIKCDTTTGRVDGCIVFKDRMKQVVRPKVGLVWSERRRIPNYSCFYLLNNDGQICAVGWKEVQAYLKNNAYTHQAKGVVPKLTSGFIRNLLEEVSVYTTTPMTTATAVGTVPTTTKPTGTVTLDEVVEDDLTT